MVWGARQVRDVSKTDTESKWCLSHCSSAHSLIPPSLIPQKKRIIYCIYLSTVYLFIYLFRCYIFKVLLCLCTTVIAGIIGVLVTLIFKRWYTQGSADMNEDVYIQLGCNTADEVTGPSYLVVNQTNGDVVCDSVANYEDEDLIEMTYWSFTDVNNSFVMKNGGVADVSLSDTLYEGVFMKLITE